MKTEMPRKEKNIHYIYRTKCLVTGTWYVGMHSTCDINDGYMGSGVRLRRSIRKYGVNNHIKDIVEFFENRDLLVEAEKKAITSEMITDINCMNLMPGGNGGFISDEQQKHRSICANKVLNEKLKNDTVFKEQWLKKMKFGIQKAMDEGKMKTWKDNYNWIGKKHSEETKQKMSESSKGKGTGETNSQYGTCWITKDGMNKKIKKEELETYLKDVWVKGRK